MIATSLAFSRLTRVFVRFPRRATPLTSRTGGLCTATALSVRALSLGGAQELARVPSRADVVLVRAEHARQLADELVRLQRRHGGARDRGRRVLGDAEVAGGPRRDQRQEGEAPGHEPLRPRAP